MYRMIYQPHLHCVYRELLERWRSRVMYRMIHQPHLRCVYRELQLSFISLLSLSLAYVGNILVRRYRPLTPCCEIIYLRTYPAVPSRFTITTYPAVPFVFYALTLLCAYFSAHLECYSKSIRTTASRYAQTPPQSEAMEKRIINIEIRSGKKKL